jgi:hypothetical protein
MKTLPVALFAVICAFQSAAIAAAPPPDAGSVPAGFEARDWSGILGAHTTWRKSFRQVSGGFSVQHPAQQWRASFDSRGFTAVSDDGAWEWGLELDGYGFPDSLRTVTGEAGAMNADGTRLVRNWDDSLQEWYVNDAQGLEHGFTVWQRPAGGVRNDALIIDLTVRGDLAAQPGGNGCGVMFVNPAEQPVLNYCGLKVCDARGQVLAARMTLPGPRRVRFEIEETGAHYPLTVDPVAAPVYVKAFNPGGGDRFGYAAAISGDTAVVGAYLEDGNGAGVNPPDNNLLGETGAAYVFVRNAGVWTQQAYLKASNPTAGDFFGSSVAISGDTIVAGANFEDGSGTGVNPPSDNNAEQAGAAYVFVRSGGAWSQQAYLKASNTGFNDQFGISVAVSGDMAAVGAHMEDGGGTGINPPSNENAGGAGAIYVFVRSGGVWTQQAYLKASNAGVNDNLGFSLALSGNTLVAGAYGEDGGGSGVNPLPNEGITDSGAAYVFGRNGMVWSQQAYLKASNPGPNDRFAFSVAVSGNTVVCGADGEDGTGTGVNPPENNGAFDSGAAYVFARNGTVWTPQAYLKPGNPGSNDQFGFSVAVSGDMVVVGAPREDGSGTRLDPAANDGISDSGAAYTYLRSGGGWSLQHYVKAINTGNSDLFGYAVGVSGDTAIIGAYDEDGGGTGINPPDTAFLAAAGAAYLYSGLGPLPDQDSDGLADALETYFGTAPGVPNGTPLTVSLSSGQLRLRWPEVNTTGVTVIPQWSPDLITWLAGGESRNGIPARNLPVSGAGGNLREASLSISGLTRASLRLKLTCP